MRSAADQAVTWPGVGVAVPRLEEAFQLRGQGQLLPIYREYLADAETPVSAYVKLKGEGPSFLLESVEGGERQGRYSIVAADPAQTLRFSREGGGELVSYPRSGGGAQVQPVGQRDPLAALQDILDQRRAVPVPDLPRFHGGVIGYLGYDLIRCYEDVGPARPDPYGLPLAELALCDTLVVFDHVRHTLRVVTHARLDGHLEAEYGAALARIDAVIAKLRSRPPDRAGDPALAALPPLEPRAPIGDANMSRADYERLVLTAKEYIAAGDIFQVVLAQRFQAPTRASALAIYRALRVINPSPYMYLLDFGPYQLVGSSPELLVGVEDGVVSTHPIAGSRPRGRTVEEDRRLERELLASEKDRAEHVMLVDLGRNDVGRVAVPGTVQVDGLMFIERYSHVMHLVTHVTGRLRPDLTPLDALRACFPAGTVSGAPKIRAMQIISELEPEGRGPYAGAIGYFGYSGSLETAITIRTLVLKDGVAHVQAGGGIVADSDPGAEYEESVAKAQALLTSLRLAEALTSGQSRAEAGRA